MKDVFDWNASRQLGIVQILAATFIPGAFALFGFHGFLPLLVRQGIPPLLAWSGLAAAMLGILVALAVMLLRREARQLGITFFQRACFVKVRPRQWIIYVAIMVAGILATAVIQPLVKQAIMGTAFQVPAYMPFFLNPALDPSKIPMAILSPGMPLSQNWPFLGLFSLALVLNILAEELYFRAWMLPKLSRFGRASWVLNGSLFAIYHIFQPWMIPAIFIPSLLFAFIFRNSRSIWPSLLGHLVGNFLFSVLGILMLMLA